MEGVSQVFLENGLLGAVLLVALWTAYRVYKDMRAIQEEHREDLKVIRTDHQSEMKELQERYIAKAESWMAKYHDLAHAQTEVLEALEKRYER